jgi:hypothetical protein
VAALGAGLVVLWASSLNGLPDLREPFDRSALERIDLPDSDNAFTFYHQASAQFKGLTLIAARKVGKFQPWAKAPEVARRWLSVNRTALDLWRQGAARPAALLVRPREFHRGSELHTIKDLPRLAHLALLEATRLEEEGDLAGAWEWYRATLRSSRHAGTHGGLVQRGIAGSILELAGGPVSQWVAEPKLDSALLRQALDDTIACESLMSPFSETIQLEYISLIKAVDDSEGLLHEWDAEDPTLYRHFTGSVMARLFLYREPERSKRVARHIFANWLTQCDAPRARRPGATSKLGLYSARSDALALATTVAPEALEEWLKSTLLLEHLLPPVAQFQRLIDTEPAILGALEIMLASQLYEREHGGSATTVGALVGPYLKRVPQGYEAEQPVSLAQLPANASVEPRR